MRTTWETLKRYLFLVFGLMVNAAGVVLLAKSTLGTSPMGAIPFVLSEKYPVSLGVFTFFLYALFFLIQIVLLGKEMKKKDWLQIPLSIFFSVVIDIVVGFLGKFTPGNYIIMMVCLLVGCVLRALGVSMQVTADVAMLSGEAVMKVISRRFRWDFSVVKLLADIAMVIISVTLSIVFFGQLVGIREGTIISAIIIAPLTKVFNQRFSKVDRKFILDKSAYNIKKNFKEDSFIVTISSQSGSGGHKIAKLLSERLDLKLYDEQIPEMIAYTADMDEVYVKQHLVHLYTSRFAEFFSEHYSYAGFDAEGYEDLFEAQKMVINSLAADGNCIIVGNCSEYILRDRKNVFSIYIHGEEDVKVEFLMKEYNLSEKKAREYMKRQDRDRAVYFRQFTGEEWVSSDRYSLSIDSSILGIERTAMTLCDVLRSVTAARPGNRDKQ